MGPMREIGVEVLALAEECTELVNQNITTVNGQANHVEEIANWNGEDANESGSSVPGQEHNHFIGLLAIFVQFMPNSVEKYLPCTRAIRLR